MPRALFILLSLVAACTSGGGPGTDFPGGQVRCRPDPLAVAAGIPTARAAFATPAALDGDLAEPAWSGAQWQGEAPAFAACCDQTSLYLALRRPLDHPDLQAVGPGAGRDAAIEPGDLLCLRLAPQDRQEMFLDLAVAPDATVADRMMSWTPDGVGRYHGGYTVQGLQTASRIAGGCWSLEVAIPWAALWTTPPRPGQGASLRLQIASRTRGDSIWRTWAASAGRLEEPPSAFGLLVFGDAVAPWRVVHGELTAGPEGRLLALVLAGSVEGPAEIEVAGALTGRLRVQLDPPASRLLLPLQPSSQAQRPDGYRLFSAQVRIAGRVWPLGGWNLRDPAASEAGAMVVAGVGGEAAGLPIAASGLGLAALAIPRGRTAVDLRLRPLAEGPGPWRLRVALDAPGGARELAELVIPGFPAVAAVPTGGLPSGSHRLLATLADPLGHVVVSAVLPLEIVP